MDPHMSFEDFCTKKKIDAEKFKKTEPEYYQELDPERYYPRKPLIWLWEMFDKSPLGENVHREEILRETVVPARQAPAVTVVHGPNPHSPASTQSLTVLKSSSWSATRSKYLRALPRSSIR